MMRGKKHFAVACRRADGTIESTAEPIEGGILKALKWLNRPLLRGTFMLVDSLVLGMKSLMWAANIAMADEQAKAKGADASANPTPAADAPKSKAMDIALSATVFVSLGLAVLFFKFLPILLAGWMLKAPDHNKIWNGVLEGGIKLVFLFLYIWGISHMKDIKRVFQYHGAEHKTINAYESGIPLNVEDVQKHTTVHVRCGTSFLLVVIFVSVIVYMFLPYEHRLLRLGYQLALLPVVAGIAYEVIKLAGNHKHSPFMRLILGPGLLMQRITTQEPSDDQVEVAIRSFQAVKEIEETETAPATQ